MKVFFSCSTDSLLANQDAYLEVLKVIRASGHEITRNWLAKSLDLAQKKQEDIKRKNVYSEVMSAIIAADVCIFDCTVQSMSIGHQLTFSIDKGKPTLLIARETGEKIEDLFISGSNSNLLILKNYSSALQVGSIVREFLLTSYKKSKTRFQLVMDKNQNDFVEWASFQYRRNKSDIIKHAIDKMAEQDTIYQHYKNDQP